MCQIDPVLRLGDGRDAVVLRAMLSRDHVLLARTRRGPGFEPPLAGVGAASHWRLPLGGTLYAQHGQDADLTPRRTGMVTNRARPSRQTTCR